jgi:type I restriction enzyme, S subunit
VSPLPHRWVRVRLDEVAEVRLGRQRSPKNHSGERMRPYIRAANLTWAGLDLSDVKEMNFSESESAIYELREGDVLVAEASGSADEVGKPALWRGELESCCFQNTVVRVRSSGIAPEFLRYFLLGEARSGRIGRAAPGVGIHHIGSGRLAAWPVPVPPLAEQRRIVVAIEEQFSRLDDSDGALRVALARIEALRRAVTRRAFQLQWPERPLVELTPDDRPICYGILMPKDHVENGVLYVRVRDFPQDRIEVSQLRRTSVEIAEKYRRSTLRDGDVLVSIRGTYGRVAIVAPELAGANITQDTARVSPGAGVDGGYLSAFLRSDPAQRYFQRVARGVAVKGVNIGDLRQLRVPVPPLDEQRRIVAEIEEQLSLVRSLRTSVEAAKRRSAVMRRAILDCAFRGELVPQDPDDEPASVLLQCIRAERAAAPKPKRRRRVPA